MTNPRKQGLLLIENILEELESPKGNISSSVKKLKRAAILLDLKNVSIWCDIQLGKINITSLLTELVSKYLEHDKHKTKKTEEELRNVVESLKKEGVILGTHISNEELTAKSLKEGGGFREIDFIEERYNDLVRAKKGNDSVYYKNHLYATLSVVKNSAHKYATAIYKKFAFQELPESNFEVLKKEVEDVLFDLNPELAEKLLLAFKSVSSDKPEEWSHALTTCRRFFEQLADSLYPASELKLNGRALGQTNYINRIWAFMDKSIESDSNKELAKTHVDLLGVYLQNTFKIANKGVHTGLTRIEALKAVMHIYLLCADLLKYLIKVPTNSRKLNIHNATLDELESVGNVSRTIAKAIVRLRVEKDSLDEDILKTIPKITQKSLKALNENFSFEPLSK